MFRQVEIGKNVRYKVRLNRLAIIRFFCTMDKRVGWQTQNYTSISSRLRQMSILDVTFVLCGRCYI